MARTERAQRDPVNLDSLLDTMTNVVGILIVLIAVAQLGLGDAVERIRETERGEAANVAAELAEAQRAYTELEAAVEDAQDEWAGRSETSSGIRRALDDATEDLERLQRLPADPDLFGLGVDALSAEVDRRRDGLVALEDAVEAGEHARAMLEARWREREARPESLVARLPDPRPAPAGHVPADVLCRYGRAGAVDAGRLIEARQRAFDAALGRPTSGRHGIAPDDVPWIENYFSKVEVGAEGLRWEIDRAARSPFFLSWASTERGETASRLRAGGSAYDRWLDLRDPEREFVHFVVWPDAFEVYLEARAHAEARGLRAGWTLADADTPLVIGQRRGFEVD